MTAKKTVKILPETYKPRQRRNWRKMSGLSRKCECADSGEVSALIRNETTLILPAVGRRADQPAACGVEVQI